VKSIRSDQVPPSSWINWTKIYALSTAFPLLLTSLIYMIYFSLIEMPSRSKHLYINCWLRLFVLQLLFHFRPDPSASIASSAAIDRGLAFVWCFAVHYAFNSSWLWQVFHVISLYQLLTQTSNQRTNNHKPFTASARRVAPRNRPLIRLYAFGAIFGILLSAWQTICSGPESMFNWSNNAHRSPIGSPLLLAWALPAIALIVHFTITVLIASLLRTANKHVSIKPSPLYFDRDTAFHGSEGLPCRPEPPNACLLKPDLLNNTSDLYWTFAKQLRSQSVQVMLTLLFVAAAVYCVSNGAKLESSSAFVKRNQSLPVAAHDTSASDGQPIAPAHLLYEHLLTQSELSAEQMQNLQNWLVQLQNSQQNSARPKQSLGPQHLPLHVHRPEPHAQLRTTYSEPNQFNSIPVSSTTIGSPSVSVQTNEMFEQHLFVRFVRQQSFSLAAACLSLFVFVQFVLQREDVRVAIAAGACGSCWGVLALFSCLRLCKTNGSNAPDDSLQRAKVKAMREQLRLASAECESGQRALSANRRAEASAMDSGQFSSQPSCTITQSLSSCSGHGLTGSTRGGTLLRTHTSELNGNDILNHSIALESFQQLKPSQMSTAMLNKQHVYYEAGPSNVIANNDEYNFWSLMRNNRPNDSIVQSANSSSRVQLLGTVEQPHVSQLNSLMTQQLLNSSHPIRPQRAFDDVSFF
jgi:hypothetical protein